MPTTINYKHLHYFWTVAKEGSIAVASERLHITPQTISGQLSLLEDAIGEKLFERQGRGLVLSEKGRTVFRYAEEIFSLGNELQDVLRGAQPEGRIEFAVGILDCIPKTIVYKLLEPALQLGENISFRCREGSIDQILSELSVHQLDMVLADMPLGSAYKIKAYNHSLGESGITFFAAPDLAKKYRRNFPQSLDGAPMLLPSENSTVRRAIDHWFSELEISPSIVGQFDDSALLKAFGQAGTGIFFMPSVIAGEVSKQFDVKAIGKTDAVQEHFYAISTERKVKHPAVAAICDAARDRIFL